MRLLADLCCPRPSINKRERHERRRLLAARARGKPSGFKAIPHGFEQRVHWTQCVIVGNDYSRDDLSQISQHPELTAPSRRRDKAVPERVSGKQYHRVACRKRCEHGRSKSKRPAPAEEANSLQWRCDTESGRGIEITLIQVR